MNDRIGDYLWHEWDGDLFEAESEESTIYYTFEHIDVENDLIKRALASAIQRDGVVHSLGDAFKLIETGSVTHGWVGEEPEGLSYVVCDESGETYYGDLLFNVQEITFIEF